MKPGSAPAAGLAGERDRTIVVGGGLAGLICAGMLVAAGRNVLLLEAESTLGGRVRTEVTAGGYRIDRGFQVLFSAYPALRRHVSLRALQPQYFGAGVEIMLEGAARVIGHPAFDPLSLPGTVRSGSVTWDDARALMATLAGALDLGDRPLPDGGISTRDALSGGGFSHSFIEQVAGPLFGGISLDRSLSSDATFWRFVLRNLALGRVFVPAFGMGQLSALLASRLPTASVRLGARVTQVLVEGDRVSGVAVGGDVLPAASVVVAAEAPVGAELTGLRLPEGARSCTTIYFASDRPVTHSRRLILNGVPSLVNHVAQMSNVSSAYAPRGKHLLAATALAVPPGDDAALAGAMRRDLQTWLPHAERLDPLPVAVVRMPFAQFKQEPGVYRALPAPATEVEGLYLAGEYLHSSSVQGAMRGGELAAAAVLGAPL